MYLETTEQWTLLLRDGILTHLLKISSNWFCFGFGLEGFLVGYMKYIPGLLPFKFVLGHCLEKKGIQLNCLYFEPQMI